MSEEPVQSQFTADEIHELLSLFKSGLPVNSASGWETVEDRKRKRMKSNRESASRSRQRKKRHLENLSNQLNRLRIENRELKNRLCLVAHQCHGVMRETNQLRSEIMNLQTKLSGLNHILVTMQFQ